MKLLDTSMTIWWADMRHNIKVNPSVKASIKGDEVVVQGKKLDPLAITLEGTIREALKKGNVIDIEISRFNSWATRIQKHGNFITLWHEKGFTRIEICDDSCTYDVVVNAIRKEFKKDGNLYLSTHGTYAPGGSEDEITEMD